MNITFVTSMFHLQNVDTDTTANSEKSISWRIDRFKEIAETGIHLCIYVCPVYNRELLPILHEFPNAKIVRVLEIKDTWFHSACDKYNDKYNDNPERQYSLPAVRNEQKDTADYMKVNHSKIEFVADTIRRNPWLTTYFGSISVFRTFFPKKVKKTPWIFYDESGHFVYPKNNKPPSPQFAESQSPDVGVNSTDNI